MTIDARGTARAHAPHSRDRVVDGCVKLYRTLAELPGTHSMLPLR